LRQGLGHQIVVRLHIHALGGEKHLAAAHEVGIDEVAVVAVQGAVAQHEEHGYVSRDALALFYGDNIITSPREGVSQIVVILFQRLVAVSYK